MATSYANRTLIIGVLDISLYIDCTKKVYEATVTYWERYFKSVHLEGLGQETISNLNYSEELPENIDYVFYPTVMDLLTERVKGNVTVIQKPFETSALIMVATTPQSVSLSSLENVADGWVGLKQFLAMSISTCFGILATIITVSFLLCISEIYSLKKKLPANKLLVIFLKYAWESTMIIFYEPFGNISRRISQRIICGVWILACVVIVSELGGAMKSKYSFVDYNHIKDIEEITPGSRWQPRSINRQSAERLIGLMAKIKPKFQYVVDKMASFDHDRMADQLFYQNIGENDVIFYLKYVFDNTFGPCVVTGVFEKKEIPRLYISKQFREIYIVHPLSFEISQDKTFRKLFDFFQNAYIETKWPEQFWAENKFHVESVRWHPQTTDTNSISFKDVIPPFRLYAYGNIIATFTTLLEFLIAYYTGNLPL